MMMAHIFQSIKRNMKKKNIRVPPPIPMPSSCPKDGVTYFFKFVIQCLFSNSTKPKNSSPAHNFIIIFYFTSRISKTIDNEHRYTGLLQKICQNKRIYQNRMQWKIWKILKVLTIPLFLSHPWFILLCYDCICIRNRIVM